MTKACKILKIEMRTITSDWRESKDIKIAFLKASVRHEHGADISIATALYGVAAKEKLNTYSWSIFRAEHPGHFNYLDGKYLKVLKV